MKINKLYICLKLIAGLNLLTCCFNASAQSNDIFFESITTENGLSQLTVSCIYQDSRGFIWFGTQDGLNRYDGYSIEVFRATSNENGISNNQINSIAEDSIGNLWIGTEGGLNCFDYETGVFKKFFKGSDTKYNISHDKVSYVFRDRDDNIWIGTEKGIDLLDLETQTFQKRTFDNFLFNNRIITLHEDSYGNLWIGTLKGLVRFNKGDNSFRIFKHEGSSPGTISDSHIRSVYEDSRRNLWIGTSNGLNLYDPRKDQFLLFGKDIYSDLSLTNNAVRCIVEDFNNNLLIGTNEGLNIFSYETREIKQYAPKKMIPGGLNHFFVYSLLVDNAGTVWIGTYFGGVNYFNLTNQQFKYFNPGNELVYGSIGKIYQQNNEYWIGTGGGGLLNYDKNFKFQDQYLFEPQLSQTNSGNIIRTLSHDNRYLYISTERQLLIFDIEKKQVVDKVRATNGSITDIYKNSDGDLMLCVNDTLGLRKFNYPDSKTAPVTYMNEAGREMIFPFTTCILEESPGIYWIGTRYVGLYYYNSITRTVKRYEDFHDETSLKSNYITSLYIDNSNNFWIGTQTGGISRFDREREVFYTYDLDDGLPNLEIRGILEDDAGYIWIATRSGVSRLDPVNGEFINYNKENGFPLQEVSEYSFTHLEDGQIAVGGNNGFTVFDPLKIKTNTFVPPVLVTNFRLLNVNSKERKDNRDVANGQNRFRLSSNQSSFMIEYTALNFIYPGKNQYAYKLEGFDTDWNYVGNQRTATFTNLNAGEYVFRVKAANNDGVWNESGKTLFIKVLPAPWKTWWAYSIYLLVLSGLFFLILHYLRLENKIKIKQLEQENSEKEHQLRIRMFTNFSHELRTPLTLITSPVEDILNDTRLQENVRSSLLLIRKNAYRLMGLVNQLMDFRKQESGKENLKAAEGKFNGFLAEISIAYNAIAVKKKINYTITGIDQEILLWYDRQQLEKVFYNILSNAFKNTNNRGSITVSVFKMGISGLKNIPESKRNMLLKTGATEFVQTCVKNTGKGIPAGELEKIFDPFYQVMDSDNRHAVGTGIGLSLVKGITELHHGVVYAESAMGEWSQFKVILPLGSNHLAEHEINKDYVSSEHVNNYIYYEPSVGEEKLYVPETLNKGRFTLLLVDDNDDIREYIKTSLQNYYNITEASNGKEGLLKAKEIMPDLIISDIMMPEVDGLQLCQQLKRDLHTSHIPIILLTARTTFIQVKEGFDMGADDYLIKPFNMNILKLKINGVLENRERLKQAFGKKLPFELSESETSSVDEQFMHKVYQAIEKNLSNPDFLIDDLSSEVGMSRASLYRKIKALTNSSANEFIKNYRLQVAIKYLREKDLSISEIAYKTGFKNPAYFTNCFKKAYKMSPTKYLQSIGISNTVTGLAD